MPDDNKVLVNRTRVDKDDWSKLKLIAQVLTERGKATTREDLTALAIKSLREYYEQELGI